MHQQHKPDLSREMKELLRLAELGEAILKRTKDLGETIETRTRLLDQDGKLSSLSDRPDDGSSSSSDLPS